LTVERDHGYDTDLGAVERRRRRITRSRATMSVIRVGSTGKYADGWEQIFGGVGGGRSGRPAAKKATPKGKAKKATAKKAAAPKAAKKKAKSRGR
jgi:hypothetical protein